MTLEKTVLTLDLGAIVDPVCRANGVEMVHTQWLRQPGASILRVIIDRNTDSAAQDPGTSDALKPDALKESLPGGSGVTLEDCQAVSRALSVALDVHEEALPGQYRLEVSSPGLERPLVRAKDFLRFEGREAKIKTIRPIEGRRGFTGVLRGMRESETTHSESALIEVEGETFCIPLADISKAHLVVRF